MVRGSKAGLRPPEEGDLPLLQQWLQDPALCRLRGARREPRGPTSMLDWLEERRERLDPLEGMTLVVVDGRERLVGLVDTGPSDPVDRQVEVGILIGRAEDRGKGLGREAMRVLLDHLVDDLGVHKVRALVMADNARARAFHLAAGFVEEGLLRQHRFVAGAWSDMVAMGLLADEHRQGRASS